MIVKSKGTISLIVLLLFVQSASAQYLPNPSFEGTPMPHVPPPGWAICTFGNSTPDTQPGNFGVYTPPSHGNTYLGMTAREDFTWEDVHSVLITPLSVDSCYIFKIDMAFQEIVNGLTMQPITLKIYGHNTTCDKTNMLWQSPGISNEEWETHEFPISPTDFDITDIVLEVYYTDGSNPYWGYVLMDNIRITNEPNVDLGNDTTLTLCENGELVLNAGSGYNSYIWSTGSGDSTITVDTTGTYWVQVMNQYGCSASDTIEVIIEDYIEMVTMMIDSTLVCEGQEVTIFVNVMNGAEPYSYAWQGLDDTTTSVTVIVDSTAYYVVEITDECGNVIADSIKMVVVDGPDIDLGDDLLICFGEEVELSAGPGFNSYLWQDGSQDSVFMVSGAGWYWVTVSDAMGCVNTDSVFVENYPEVQIDLGNDTLLCEIDNVLLDAGSGWINYLWYDSTILQTNIVSEPGSYWVIVEDVNGCTGSDTINVELSPAVVVSLGGDTTVCSGDNYVLNPGADFVSYLWHDGSSGSSYAVTNPGTFWVSVTDVNGCFGSDTVTVGLNPSPEVNLGSDTTLCTGSTLVLDPGSQYSSYLWQDNSGLPIYTVTSTGYYSVTVTNIFNCPATDEIFVEVTSPSIDLGNDTLLCLGDTLYLDPGQGYMSYLWQDNTTNSIYEVTAGGSYSVEVLDIYECTSVENIEITSLAKPVADLGGDQELCAGEILILETAEGPYNYEWNGESGNFNFEIHSGGTYMVEVTNQCGAESDMITVTEFPVPEVDLGPDQVLQPGESIHLDAGEGFDQYIWQDGTGNQYYVVSSDQADPEDPYYWVEVWDGPCKSSDTTRIELFKVKIPNVITPNGDGINDTFTPMDGSWSGVNSHHIEVFNRWGEKVWESDDFESGWDGKHNATYVAEGTYFWVLDVYYGPEDIKQTIKGTVTVLGANP